MRKIHGKRFWSIAIVIAFLLNSVPYPAYGMRMLKEASRLDGRGVEDKKFEKDVIGTAYAVGDISHVNMNLFLLKMARLGLLGNIVGSTPEELVEKFGELKPNLITKHIVRNYKVVAKDALDEVNERYKYKLQQFRDWMENDPNLEEVDTAASRVTIFNIDRENGQPLQEAIDLVHELFDSGFLYEHAGRYGIHMYRPLLVQLAEEKRKIEGLQKGESALQRMYTHAIFELMIANCIIAFEEEIKGVEEEHIKGNLSLDETKKSKGHFYDLLILRLGELGISQWSAEEILLKKGMDSYPASAIGFKVEKASTVLSSICRTTAHELVEKAKDSEGNLYASVQPIQFILDEQEAEDRGKGLIQVAAEEKKKPTRVSSARQIGVGYIARGDELAKAKTEDTSEFDVASDMDKVREIIGKIVPYCPAGSRLFLRHLAEGKLSLTAENIEKVRDIITEEIVRKTAEVEPATTAKLPFSAQELSGKAEFLDAEVIFTREEKLKLGMKRFFINLSKNLLPTKEVIIYIVARTEGEVQKIQDAWNSYGLAYPFVKVIGPEEAKKIASKYMKQGRVKNMRASISKKTAIEGRWPEYIPESQKTGIWVGEENDMELLLSALEADLNFLVGRKILSAEWRERLVKTFVNNGIEKEDAEGLADEVKIEAETALEEGRAVTWRPVRIHPADYQKRQDVQREAAELEELLRKMG